MAVEDMTDPNAIPAVVAIDRRTVPPPQTDPNQANPTLTAMAQLLTFVTCVTAVCVLAVSHALPKDSVAALIGAIVAHGGITAYNGATKGSRNG